MQTGARAGETFFERVVFLALSLQSCATLTCAALWMQVRTLAANTALQPELCAVITSTHCGVCMCSTLISPPPPPPTPGPPR